MYSKSKSRSLKTLPAQYLPLKVSHTLCEIRIHRNGTNRALHQVLMVEFWLLMAVIKCCDKRSRQAVLSSVVTVERGLALAVITERYYR